VRHCLRNPTFSRFDTIPKCDRQTDTHTHTRRRHIPRLARRRAVKRGTDRSSTPKKLSFNVKIVKISPADLEIICLREIIKKDKEKRKKL